MSQAVICRPFTAAARVLSQVISHEICGGLSGTGAGFSPSIPVFTPPLPVTPSTICCFENRRSLSREILYTFSNSFDEAGHILKAYISYWCSLLLIQLCSDMKGIWDGDWRLDLFNVLYLCCQLEHIQIQQGADKCNCGVLRWDALEGVIYILQTYSIILILLNLFDMLAEE